MKDARGLTISGDETTLKGNFANEGSVLYVNDADENIDGRYSINLNRLTFENNGINYNDDLDTIRTTNLVKSKSMIYYSAIGTNGGDKDPIILNMESPTIKRGLNQTLKL